MAPTLADGDVVLAWMNAAVRPGAVVLARWAHRPHQLSIKRAACPVGAQWSVLGDNPDGSTDSRTLGPATVVGVAVWRLWPHPRRLSRGSGRR